MKRFCSSAVLSVVVFLPLAAQSQSATDTAPKVKSADKKTTKDEEELVIAQRHAFAISQVISIAEEARSYQDIALRPHVLARAADTLWDVVPGTARRIFHRAWDA